MANNDRRDQQGKSGSWLLNPLNAAAAVWGTAVGIGCAVLGIRRSEGRKEPERAAGPLPERPETSGGAQPQPGPGGGPPRQRASQAKPEPSTKAAPTGQAAGRRSATARETARRGARPAAPAKQGTAAKSTGLSDKGGSQRPAGASQPGASAGARPSAGKQPSGARPTTSAPPRPKASDKHPAQPRPGQAAREEPPASGGPPAMAPASVEPQRPPALDQPRGGKADDLKQITGIGPKLEEKLNGLGIYHYDQIAGWGDSDVRWIDAELQAKGRVERDNWVGQAAALKAGAKPKG